MISGERGKQQKARHVFMGLSKSRAAFTSCGALADGFSSKHRLRAGLSYGCRSLPSPMVSMGRW